MPIGARRKPVRKDPRKIFGRDANTVILDDKLNPARNAGADPQRDELGCCIRSLITGVFGVPD